MTGDRNPANISTVPAYPGEIDRYGDVDMNSGKNQTVFVFRKEPPAAVEKEILSSGNCATWANAGYDTPYNRMLESTGYSPRKLERLNRRSEKAMNWLLFVGMAFALVVIYACVASALSMMI